MKKIEMFGAVVVFVALVAFVPYISDVWACSSSATNACITAAKVCSGACDVAPDDETCGCQKEDGDINGLCNCSGTKKPNGGGVG